MTDVAEGVSALTSPIFPMVLISSIAKERTEKGLPSEFNPLSVGRGGVTRQLEGVAKSQSNDARKVVRKGDLVINSRSDRRGASGLSRHEGVVSLVYTVLEPNSEVLDSKYGHYLLRCTAFQEEFFKWGTGIVDDLWSTNYSRMSRIRVPLPPLEAQRHIADYLDRETVEIDEMIDKLNDLALQLNDRNAAFPDNIFDDLYREKTVPLWSILEPVKDQGFPDEEVLSVYRDYGVILKSSRDDNINTTPDNLNPYQLVLPGDVVINKMKAWQGSLGVSEYKGIVSPDYQVARPTVELHPRYIHSVLRCSRMISQYKNRSIGVRPAQWRLYWSEMSTLHIPIPPLAEQRRIADHLDDVTSKIDAMLIKVAQLKDLLTERRAALITDVVTGRKDVA